VLYEQKIFGNLFYLAVAEVAMVSFYHHQDCGVIAIHLQILLTFTFLLYGLWSAVVHIHRGLIWQGHICAYRKTWILTLDLSGRNSVKTAVILVQLFRGRNIEIFVFTVSDLMGCFAQKLT